MLKKALRQLDEGVTRLAVLSLRSFIWPVFVSIAVGSGAWMAFHQKRLGLHSQNKVPQPERMEAFWWTIAAFGCVLALHALVGLIVRWRSGEFQSVKVTRLVNQATSFLLATPFVAMLLTPSLEHKRPIMTMVYVIVAGLCFVPTFMLLAREPPLDEQLEDGRLSERIGQWVTPVILVLMFLGYGLFFSRLSIIHHHGMGTRTIDLGYYDNIF
ncbi:MAG: hypothetical protein RIF41_19805, partial [Polyangiaceae bacterium]